MFFAFLLLVSCNNESDLDLYNSSELVSYETDSITQRYTVQQLLENATTDWRDEENFLYDINLLVQTLEENFPFIGVAERITGVENPIDTLQNRLFHNSQYTSNHEFANLIENAFRNIFFNLAHLDMNPPYQFRTMNASLVHNEPIPFEPKIIEEGKIALLPIPPQFFNRTSADPFSMREVQNFIAQIQGYEHVILDLRRIGGGNFDSSIAAFIAPNISEPLIFQEFTFITNGEIARNTYERQLEIAQSNRTSNTMIVRQLVDSPLVPAVDFVEQHNLTNMNQDDLQNLAYGFLLETTITNTDGVVRLPLQAENIWLLIGSNNFSAATIFSQIAKEAGFTLVGQQANNRNSWGRASFRLPRTNNLVVMDTFYITDNTGRNTEEFPIEPHYFNRPGMDALQTTLAIIAERSENE